MRHYGHFQLAHQLHKQLHEVMGWTGPMTHRQYVAWQEWLEMQWNHPDRSDYYTMQLTAVVQRILAKNPNSIKVEKMRMQFGNSTRPQRRHNMTKEQSTALSKFRWGMLLRSASGDKWVPPHSPQIQGQAQEQAQASPIDEKYPLPDIDTIFPPENSYPLVEE